MLQVSVIQHYTSLSSMLMSYNFRFIEGCTLITSDCTHNLISSPYHTVSMTKSEGLADLVDDIERNRNEKFLHLCAKELCYK